MNRDEKKQKLIKFFELLEEPRAVDLGGALYSMSELGLWPDNVDSVSVEQALLCWRIVEKLRNVYEFPKELRM